jgi:KipI family sensor histidine kinase inhibitor
VGDAALLAEVPGPAAARRLAAAVVDAAVPGVIDVVPGLRTVLVTLDPAVVDLEEVADWIGRLDLQAHPVPEPRTHEVAVRVDGPDVDEVCRRTGLDPAGLAALLAGADLEVAMMGFSPGFGYLRGLPEPLASLPRRDTPRPSVPAGSLALAGGFAAIYPQSTPGGWQVVGRTDEVLFDPSTPPYARLSPGDLVRLVLAPGPGGAPGARPPAPERAARPPFAVPERGRALLVVEEPGAFTTVQDAGRGGLAHLGVPGAGPADPLAHALANGLVGNRRAGAALEVTARGPVLRCLAPLHLAVVGGGATVSIDGRPAGAGRVLPVGPGQRVAVGPTAGGLRACVAVAGGLSAPAALGSCATDVLSWLGPGPLVAGDVLGSAAPAGPMRGHLDAGALARGVPGWGADATAARRVRVLPGPHPGWFPDGALERLGATRFVVDASGNRVGLRLRAESGGALGRRAGELDPQGMVTGAVQVPPGGDPVVLGPDHATTGGYPVLAVVVSADRWVLGQCRPGDVIEFEVVSAAAAASARAAQARAVAAALVGRYPLVAG